MPDEVGVGETIHRDAKECRAPHHPTIVWSISQLSTHGLYLASFPPLPTYLVLRYPTPQ